VLREWTFASDLEGWSLQHSLTGAVRDGQLELSVTGPDPYLSSPDGLGIEASQFHAVRIVMKHALSDGNGQLYWKTRDGVMHVAALPLSAPRSEFGETIVNLRGAPGWSGLIDQIRIDPGNGAAGNVAIDSVAIIAGQGETLPGWAYLDNGKIRIGINPEHGASIGFFGESGGGLNLLDHADNGRYLQQSYYGDDVGGQWAGKPWVFNPVQGGSSQGFPSRVEALRVSGRELYAKTIPKDWGGGNEDTPCTMEQWITLDGSVARVRFAFEYHGTQVHSVHPQEVPAFFVRRSLSRLMFYKGPAPWTDAPLTTKVPFQLTGTGVDPFTFDEPWAAYVDEKDWGIGLYSKTANNGVSYLVGDAFTGDAGPVSYFAFTDQFALTPGFKHEYTALVALGALSDLRRTFHAAHVRGE
jgi:hypothetical protein